MDELPSRSPFDRLLLLRVSIFSIYLRIFQTLYPVQVAKKSPRDLYQAMSSMNIDPSQNRGPAILGAVISVWCVAIVAVFLRFVARKASNLALWLDDYLICAGTV